jgi:preprotein translocase subunit SecG
MNQILAQIVYPNPILIFGLMLMIFLDLMSGIRKASKNGEATTSRGLRNTIDKATTYCTFIFSVLIIVNITSFADTDKDFLGVFKYSLNGLIIGTSYIELKSIIENLIAINTKEDKPSDFCIYFLTPLHNLLILKLAKKYKDE